MKKLLFSLVNILLLGFIIGCQQQDSAEKNAISPSVKKNKSAANARRACSNQVAYRFIYSGDYAINPNGCLDYKAYTGVPKSITVLLQNISGSTKNMSLDIHIPSNCGSYSLVSITGGGSTSDVTTTSYGYSWTPTMTGFTTYELTYTFTAYNGACEGITYLNLNSPCTQSTNYDCFEDDMMRLVRFP